MKRAGKFITLEGGEGSGKSTCVKAIAHWFEKNDVPYIVTREPGGTPLAEDIRKLVLDHREERVDDLTELLLVFAARAQHIQEKILPALSRGIWVLSDRFVDSSFVYQGAARNGDMDKIQTLSDWVVGECLPDKTFLLDIEVETGLQRVVKRNQSDRLDGESIQFHQKVRNAFLVRAGGEPERFVVIDAAQTQLQVAEDVVKELDSLLAMEC